jgi:SHS family lactate transporter-like MFS transporter
LGSGRVRPPLVDVPALIARTYLFTNDCLTLAIGCSVQGLFGGAIYGQNPSYLSERFPTEVRATAAGVCYHQGAIFGGLVAPVLTCVAVNYNVGFGAAKCWARRPDWSASSSHCCLARRPGARR